MVSTLSRLLAAIVMVADEEKAREALDTLLADRSPDATTYRDVTYQTSYDDSAAGIVDEALILASSSDAFEAIVDARRDGALDEVADFTAAADRPPTTRSSSPTSMATRSVRRWKLSRTSSWPALTR